MTIIAILLAILGAVFFAVGALLQHGVVAGMPGSPRITDLVRTPRWLGGLLLLGGGAGVHAVALGMAPLTVVQPVGVLAVAITAVLDRRRRDLPAVAVTTLGVGTFVMVAADSTTSTAVGANAQLRAAFIVLGIVAALTLIGAISSRPAIRGMCFGAAGGAAYGFVSVLMRAVSLEVREGTIGFETAVSAAAMVVALLVGGWLVQLAYRCGPPHLAVACLTVVDPLVAVGLGAGVLGEAAQPAGWATAVALAAAAVAVGGVVALSRSSSSPVQSSRSEQPVNDDRALRIVVAAETYPPDVNGAAHFAHRLATGLAGRGHEVHVITVDPEGEARTERTGDVVVHRVRSHRTPFHRTFRIGLPWEVSSDVSSLLREIQPDLVHVQAHFVVGRYVLRHAAAMGVPGVATNHFMPENLFGHLHVPEWLRGAASRWAWRDLTRVFSTARVVTAPTPRAVELLHSNGFPQRAIAVSCGIDIDRYRLRTAVRDSADPTVLFVGRLDEEKRVDELLRAVALVPGLRAEIVGDGSCRAQWETLADDLGIADRVRFRGFVSEEDLLDAYASADLFCMPGVAELQSLATMEAMAAGKPVVVADAMALPHLCRPGYNGWLFQPGDVAELADRLRAVTADPATQSRMGAASGKMIAAHALESTLDAFEAHYATAMGRIPAAAVDRAA
ncbi:glycosyltransferase [Amycolatopsis jejuensis]|uniref:glycosyltransferase n=1 Tax=Amycolatopsis jejuensis TaxID=330084 RepID=UPI00052729D0|nr:glycosyltransferase [Amycolatopsis jejuensis]